MDSRPNVGYHQWGDLPAKIKFADGRVVDVYPNTAEYNQLGQTITATTKDVPTLEIHMTNNTTIVFFGEGIDLVDVDVPYQALLNAYNSLEYTRQKGKKYNSFSAPESSAAKRLMRDSRTTMSNLTGTKPDDHPVQMPQWKILSNQNDLKK